MGKDKSTNWKTERRKRAWTLYQSGWMQKDIAEALGVTEDPVRLYLSQMGGIPLLTRETEVASAREIERWRQDFRQTLLTNDFVRGEWYRVPNIRTIVLMAEKTFASLGKGVVPPMETTLEKMKVFL